MNIEAEAKKILIFLSTNNSKTFFEIADELNIDIFSKYFLPLLKYLKDNNFIVLQEGTDIVHISEAGQKFINNNIIPFPKNR